MKVTKITIHYDDGKVVGANGAHAEEIMKWWNSCESLAYVHGARFTGTPLKEINIIDQPSSNEVVEGGRETKNGLIVYDGMKNYVATQGF